MNATGFVDPISNIGLVNVCHYILSFGIIFNSKGLINPEAQKQTVPVFNAFFQYLNESSNTTEVKIQLLRQMNNETDDGDAFDMKYVNETYGFIINEGLFAYYGNVTRYLLIRNFAENTNFTALKEIVFDDLSKNYINNVSCPLGNVNSNPKVDLSKIAIDNLFADYLWPVFKRTTGKNLETGEKRKLPIHRRLNRQISDNEVDSDDSSNLDMYFPNFGENSLEGSAEVVPIENLFPTFTQSNFNIRPFVDYDFSSHPKIRRIDTSTKFSGSDNEISHNEDGFVNREGSFLDMTNFQNNRLLGNPGFEIDIDDVPGNSTQSENSRIQRFLESRENRKRLGFIDESEVSAFSGSDNQQFDVKIGANREILNVNDVPGNIDKMPKSVGKKFVYVQTDYAGGKEPVDLIFINMEIDKKSKRMQSIANAAVVISSNVLYNYTFEDSLKMLKGYILKFDESSSLVPTYNQLATDFCKNNLTEPEKYNEWKIPNHELIDDILFEEDFFHGVISNKERNHIDIIVKNSKNETLKSIFEIYENSTLLQKSLRCVDFTRLRVQLWNLDQSSYKLRKERFDVTLYRFAIRECDENTKNNIMIYRHRYAGKNTGFFKVKIGGIFMFRRAVQFSADEELEMSKLNIKPERNMTAIQFQINLETNCGIPNIDRVLEGKGITGIYLIPANTEFEVIDRQKITFNREPAILIKLSYKYLKEEIMVEMIKDLHNLVKNNSKDYDFYY